MTQRTPSTITALQPYVSNTLDSKAGQYKEVAGIIGDQPSLYAKSPAIWTAVFTSLHIDAAYLPFDVALDHLKGLVRALRALPSYIGGNVTVPYKLAVMGLLDEVDPLAQRIGAVNTVKHAQDGRLFGYNTDASGAIGSLLRKTPWQLKPLIQTLENKRVLLLGAGGAGRAAAFGVAEAYGENGRLYIANRSNEASEALAAAVQSVYGHAQALDEGSVEEVLGEVDLIINSTTKGQAGLRHLPNGLVICLGPYSSLAPASPAIMETSEYETDDLLYKAWHQASADDVAQNLSLSSKLMTKVKPGAVFFDMIYAPLETPLLSQAGNMGHRTLNGKGMNILQAVDSMVMHVMPEYFKRLGWTEERAFREVTDAMAAVW